MAAMRTWYTTRSLLLVLPMAIFACDISVSNGEYTNTCGCEFSYFNGTTCWTGGPAVMTTDGLTVQNWPDTTLETTEDVCYTRTYYDSVGASTALWPAGTNSVSVNCIAAGAGGKGKRMLRMLRVLPLLALLLIPISIVYWRKKQRMAAAKSASSAVNA